MTRCLLKVCIVAATAGALGLTSIQADEPVSRGNRFSIETAQPESSAQSTNSGPRIEFAELTHDFGRIEPGQTVSYTFVFTNQGTQALDITEVRPSCSCTAAGNYSKHVEPGKAGIIPVVYSASGLSGPVGKNLWVASNDSARPSVVLRISAMISRPIDAVPGIAAFGFGPDFQTNESRVVRITSNLDEPVALSEPVCTNKEFRAELKTIQPGKEFELRVSVIPPLLPGSFSSVVTIKTSSVKMPSVEVKLYATVQPALTISPATIRLPSGSMTNALEIPVAIQSRSTNSLILSDPKINVAGADLKLREIQPGRIFQLLVTFPPNFRAPADRPLEVRVNSNHPQAPTITIPVIQPPPVQSDSSS